MNELVTSETNDLGLSIDMLDVDRLREWARLLLLHGDEINHWCWWGSVPSVASKMQIMATEMEKAIRDIGMLQRAGIITEAKLAAEGAISSPASQKEQLHCENCGAVGLQLTELMCPYCWENGAMEPRFHWRDGWFFQRVDVGVLVTLPDGTKVVIPTDEWASIVTHIEGAVTPRGTYNCPICGWNVPHREHAGEIIERLYFELNAWKSWWQHVVLMLKSGIRPGCSVSQAKLNCDELVAGRGASSPAPFISPMFDKQILIPQALAEVSSPATPQLAEPEYSEAEIAELRADFYEFIKRRNVSPEVMAMVCPWLAEGVAFSPTPARLKISEECSASYAVDDAKCHRPKGHSGMHDSGDLSWPNL